MQLFLFQLNVPSHFALPLFLLVSHQLSHFPLLSIKPSFIFPPLISFFPSFLLINSYSRFSVAILYISLFSIQSFFIFFLSSILYPSPSFISSLARAFYKLVYYFTTFLLYLFHLSSYYFFPLTLYPSFYLQTSIFFLFSVQVNHFLFKLHFLIFFLFPALTTFTKKPTIIFFLQIIFLFSSHSLHTRPAIAKEPIYQFPFFSQHFLPFSPSENLPTPAPTPTFSSRPRYHSSLGTNKGRDKSIPETKIMSTARLMNCSRWR